MADEQKLAYTSPVQPERKIVAPVRSAASGRDLEALLVWHRTAAESQSNKCGCVHPSCKRKRDLEDEGLWMERYIYKITIPFAKDSEQAREFIAAMAADHFHLGVNTCWWSTCDCGDLTHMIRSIKYKPPTKRKRRACCP